MSPPWQKIIYAWSDGTTAQGSIFLSTACKVKRKSNGQRFLSVPSKGIQQVHGQIKPGKEEYLFLDNQCHCGEWIFILWKRSKGKKILRDLFKFSHKLLVLRKQTATGNELAIIQVNHVNANDILNFEPCDVNTKTAEIPKSV
ncbi:hypothetical protein T4B_562 [Trichinella pseudospiralis]|uniref:Uncharacterized protein n=1 Tax=Trichinella pseudospiralis TaxID=6337 RepID=A0A0V1E1E6_TRIPS|nr:hypothetical protein T4A_4901 [Trichinella pseudospiralis]KRZ23810.1 hypothetical protein T4B_562 [Trichinella pseudospiralis]KRZ29943.1 hypothetical protein T4C_4457 [Trichinella pseudospiralis]